MVYEIQFNIMSVAPSHTNTDISACNKNTKERKENNQDILNKADTSVHTYILYIKKIHACTHKHTHNYSVYIVEFTNKDPHS